MKNKRTLLSQINHMSGVTLARKGLIPSYVSKLWAKSHGGITPLWWKVLERSMTFIWTIIGIAVVASGTNLMAAYWPMDPGSKALELLAPLWAIFVWIAFMIMYSTLPIFVNAKKNWTQFDYHIKELSWLSVCNDAFPATDKEFIDRLHNALIARAKCQIKERAKEDCFSMNPLREIYDAAKAFGILKLGDKGYKPYFDEARRELDKEELPLFHQESLT